MTMPSLRPSARRRLLLAALCLAPLSACATSVPQVSVTRFHNGLDAASLTVPFRTEVLPLVGGPSALEWDSYRLAVERELQRVGFGTPVTAGRSARNVVRIGVERLAIERGQRSPVSVGVGGSTGSYGSGLGIGLGLNLSGRRGPQTLHRLTVRIDRPDGTALWEGRAETAIAVGSPADQPALAAAKLAEAMFQGFPGESGRTITVE